MSWQKLNLYGPTLSDSDVEALQNTVDGQRRGYDFTALTQWASGNTTVPAVEVGTVLEINGSVFEIDTADIVIGTVPGGATDDLYIKLTVTSGTTVTADWSTTVPTWDTAKGGWFDGTDKFLPYIVDFDGATTWDNKREIVSRFTKDFVLNANGGFSSLAGQKQLATKVIDIGDWNMDATGFVAIAHGLDHTKIRTMTATIRNDIDTQIFPIPYHDINAGTPETSIVGTTTTLINLTRRSGGAFDNNQWDSTSYNRGWITIRYEA